MSDQDNSSITSKGNGGQGLPLAKLELPLILFCFFLLVGGLLAKAMAIAIDVPTYHLDGAFQTASGLYRLSEGQLPGRDFFSYLGVGPLMVLYPIFLLLGETIFASGTASYFATFLSLVISTYLVFRLADPLAPRIWAALFAVLAITTILLPIVDIPLLRERAIPGNSLRPLRAFLPFVAVFATMLILQSRLSIRRKILLTGFLAAGCFVWSNDYAAPSALVVLLCASGWLLFHGAFSWRRILSLAAVFLVGLVGVLTISSFGHPIDVLLYSFQDVRGDQYWYFGPWNPNFKIFDLKDIWTKLLPDFGWTLVFIPLVLGVAAYARRFELFCLALIGIACFLGGAIATIGGHIDTYNKAFHYWVFVTFWAGLWSLVRARLVEDNYAGQFANGAIERFLSLVAPCVVTILVLSLLIKSWAGFNDVRKAMEQDAGRYYEPALGGYLDTSWRHYAELAKASEPGSTQEEYWGLWSALARDFSPKVDSVIHALGSLRQEFFTGRDTVITTRASVSLWQQWSFSANYWFYRPLLLGYDVVDYSPKTLVWKKRKVPQEMGPFQSCALSQGGTVFQLPQADSGLYEVKIEIETSLVPSRALLMIKTNLNSVDTADGFLSVDSSKKEHVLPLRLLTEDELFFVGVLHPGDNARPPGLVRSCSFRPLPFVSADALISGFAQYQAYPLTDKYWTRGISNLDTALFVENSPANRALYRPGAVITYEDGAQWRVRGISTSKRYINVFLEGESMDPEERGYPARFKVE